MLRMGKGLRGQKQTGSEIILHDEAYIEQIDKSQSICCPH